MSRINLENKEIVVQFTYPSKGGKRGTRTDCAVLLGTSGERDQEKSVIATATVRRDSRDAPNLVRARTAAVVKALQSADALTAAEKKQVWDSLPIRTYSQIEATF